MLVITPKTASVMTFCNASGSRLCLCDCGLLWISSAVVFRLHARSDMEVLRQVGVEWRERETGGGGGGRYERDRKGEKERGEKERDRER